MKNLFTFSIAFSLVAFSCSKSKITENSSVSLQDSTKTEEKFTVDSIKVEDSLKIDDSLTVSFRSKVLIFPQIKNKALLDSIYSREDITAKVYSKQDLEIELEKKKNKLFNETKKSLTDWKPTFNQLWDSNSNMKLFSNTNNLLTVQYSGDGYTGGAHGYYYEFYKTFDLKNNKTLHLSDIISDKDPTIWSRILMDNFLKNDLEKGQAQMLLVDQIPLTENFYLDNKNLYFLYNQYEIAAYAAGPVLIKVPYATINPLLTAEIKTRLGL